MSINKLLVFCFLLISFILIVNLTRDILRLLRSGQRIGAAAVKLSKVKKENEELKKTEAYFKSNEFLEEQIRNRLQLAKPGETILILPEELKEASRSGLNKELETSEEGANWQKWLALFK